MGGTEEEFAHWISLLHGACAEDGWSEAELYRIVALHTRNLGADGHPASAALMQALLLQETLMSSAANKAPMDRVIREILRVVADAHALGHSQRIRKKHRNQLRDGSPVFSHHGTTTGCLIGQIDAELLDQVCTRIIREAQCSQATRVVIDVSGATIDPELFRRTLGDFSQVEGIEQAKIIVSGASTTLARTLGELKNEGLSFTERLSEALE